MKISNCLCCGNQRKLNLSMLCDKCDDCWSMSGMEFIVFIKWKSGKIYSGLMEGLEYGE